MINVVRAGMSHGEVLIIHRSIKVFIEDKCKRCYEN